MRNGVCNSVCNGVCNSVCNSVCNGVCNGACVFDHGFVCVRGHACVNVLRKRGVHMWCKGVMQVSVCEA